MESEEFARIWKKLVNNVPLTVLEKAFLWKPVRIGISGKAIDEKIQTLQQQEGSSSNENINQPQSAE